MGDSDGHELREAALEMADVAGIGTGNGIPTKGKPDLPAPEYEVTVTGQHSFTWNDNVTNEMFRIVGEHPARSGFDLWCFLTVYYQRSANNEPMGILNGKRWNLTSTSSTDAQIRSLNRRMAEGMWDGRLALVERKLYESLETGDELIDLSTVENPPPPSYLVWPFLEEGEHNGIAAPGGSTKSIFGMACCISYTFGVEIMPGTTMPISPDQQRKPSLYLDYESTNKTQAYRRRLLLQGINESEQEGKIYYKRLTSPIADMATEIYDIVKSRDIGLVVIDSAARATGGETSTEAMVIPFFNAVASWGVTTLTIAHKAKDSESKGPAGVAQWYNQFRNYWELIADQTPGQREVHLSFRHDKANDGSLHEPLNYRVEFSDRSITYHKSAEIRRGKVMKEMHLSTQIKSFLDDNEGSTVREIAEALGKADNQVRDELRNNEGTLFYGSEEKRGRRWWNQESKSKTETKYYWEKD